MTADMKQEIMNRLAQHRSVGSAPPEEHAWLVEHGSLHTYQVGDVVTAKGQQATRLIILFTGNIVIRMDRGAGSHKIFEWKAGDVGGVMPYSRGSSPPADALAEEVTETLVVPREDLAGLARECPALTAICVHAMLDRARMFTSADLRDEKLISLGKLASGLAHELNNPASAVARSAQMLSRSLEASEAAARRLGAARLSDAQLASIDEVRALCVSPVPGTLSAVARADREDAIAEWLGSHGGDEACAAPLADTGITLEALDALATNVSGEALDSAIKWLSAGCSVRALSGEIATAASRMYELVAAVKGFSYMDHAPTPEPVDIRTGIADTLTMLGSKTRGKSVTISVELPDDLPPAHAVGAEINQVWMNLIDNALDAARQGGHVSITGAREHDHVIVSISDDGPGIPGEIQGRVFDPFFTTKGVGQGTGLGLDIVRRLLKRHEGEVSFDSAPGRTEFRVRLPAARS